MQITKNSIETAPGRANPQVTMRIDVQCIDGVVAETLGITIVAPVSVEAAGFSLEEIEATAGGADPEIAQCVFHDCAGLGAAERVRGRGSKRIARDLVGSPVNAGQSPAECADPERTKPVFIERHDAIGWQRARIGCCRTVSAQLAVGEIQLQRLDPLTRPTRIRPDVNPKPLDPGFIGGRSHPGEGQRQERASDQRGDP